MACPPGRSCSAVAAPCSRAQYDSKPCIAYTSLYVDSQVVKWNHCEGKVLDKISVHYNIGHLMTMEGDSMDPKGRYLVALNKLSIDRFNPVGPLHPQNHQLIDISNDKMQLLYDMPLPLGEPLALAAADVLTDAVGALLPLAAPLGLALPPQRITVNHFDSATIWVANDHYMAASRI